MERRNKVVDIFLGIFIVLGLDIAVWIIAVVVKKHFSSTSGSIVNGLSTGLTCSALFIGISQLIYVIPTINLLKRQQLWGLRKGVIIGAVITALLNVSGLLILGFIVFLGMATN